MPVASSLKTLSLAGLSKRYGETVALRDLSIDFETGTVHTILGENGSGKSTLVKLLSGIVSPDAGTIRLDGAPITARNPAEFAALGFATVFQEVLIAPDRSVADNILLGMDRLWRWALPAKDRVRLVEETLANLAFTSLPLKVPAGRLPLAARQIIVIARAFVRGPSILILDEVTAALDHADRDLVFERIEQFAGQGGLVLFISHRMDEVTRLSDRITVLRSGQAVATLSRAQLDVEELLELMAPERPKGAQRG